MMKICPMKTRYFASAFAVFGGIMASAHAQIANLGENLDSVASLT
jgi:hypothetical protein